MTVEERKNIIRKNIVWKSKSRTGGQTCIFPSRECILYSPDLDVKFYVECFQPMYKNKEHAMKLFEMTLDECVR